jgi:hypothetical protein
MYYMNNKVSIISMGNSGVAGEPGIGMPKPNAPGLKF